MIEIFQLLQMIAGFAAGLAVLAAMVFLSWKWAQTPAHAQAAMMALFVAVALLIIRLATGHWPGSMD